LFYKETQVRSDEVVAYGRPPQPNPPSNVDALDCSRSIWPNFFLWM